MSFSKMTPRRWFIAAFILGAGSALGAQSAIDAVVKGLSVKMIARGDVPTRGAAGCSSATAGGVMAGTVVDVWRHGAVKRISLKFLTVDPGDEILQPITPAEERQIDDRLHCRQ
jgi:hypothetical protein